MILNNWTDFIINLYKDYRQIKVNVNRLVAAEGATRGIVNEILIMNYDEIKNNLFEF